MTNKITASRTEVPVHMIPNWHSLPQQTNGQRVIDKNA